MALLYLIRHGQASFGQANYDVLSPLGERQSAAVGRLFHRQGIRPDLAYSGSMQRQQETARLALSTLGHESEFNSMSAFDEYDSGGVFSNFLPSVLDQFPDIRDQMTPDNYDILKDRKVFQRLYFPVMQQWINGEQPPRGEVETFKTFQGRVSDGFEAIRSQMGDDDTAILFTSGGVISVLLATIMKLDWLHSAEFNWRTANASVTALGISRRGIALDSYNQYAHLHDPDNDLKVTWL